MRVEYSTRRNISISGMKFCKTREGEVVILSNLNRQAEFSKDRVFLTLCLEQWHSLASASPRIYNQGSFLFKISFSNL